MPPLYVPPSHRYTHKCIATGRATSSAGPGTFSTWSQNDLEAIGLGSSATVGGLGGGEDTGPAGCDATTVELLEEVAEDSRGCRHMEAPKQGK